MLLVDEHLEVQRTTLLEREADAEVARASSSSAAEAFEFAFAPESRSSEGHHPRPRTPTPLSSPSKRRTARADADAAEEAWAATLLLRVPFAFKAPHEGPHGEKGAARPSAAFFLGAWRRKRRTGCGQRENGRAAGLYEMARGKKPGRGPAKLKYTRLS